MADIPIEGLASIIGYRSPPGSRNVPFTIAVPDTEIDAWLVATL
jgi:hypothetical protein